MQRTTTTTPARAGGLTTRPRPTPVAVRKTPPQTIVRSEDLVGSLRSMSLRLEDGRVCVFDMATELEIPKDGKSVIDAASTAHARLAFWQYQTNRLAAKLREAQLGNDKVVTELTHKYRVLWMEETGSKFIAADTIRAIVSADPSVVLWRDKLNELQTHYESIQCVTDAVRHRMYAINKLVDQMNRAS